MNDTALIPNSHCHFCGAGYADTSSWPRKCDSCGGMAFRNPIPVGVAIVPVQYEKPTMFGPRTVYALLLVERAIAPLGLALPGGFADFPESSRGESPAQAAARELREELGIEIAADYFALTHLEGTPQGRWLAFMRSRKAIKWAELASCVLSEESSGAGLVYDPAGEYTPSELTAYEGPIQIVTPEQIESKIVFDLHAAQVRSWMKSEQERMNRLLGAEWDNANRF